MFWIPVCFLVFVGWIIKKAVNEITDISARETQIMQSAAIHEFEQLTALSREEEWEIRKQLDHSFNKQFQIVRVFMDGDIEEQDVKQFTCSILQPAYRILAAQSGHIWNGYDLYTGTTLPPEDLTMNPPWKIFELSERFLVKMESTLREKGVNAILMADYIANHFEPVREHVAAYGYGKIDGRVHFKWAYYV